MSETEQRATWGQALLAGLPHLLFPLIAEISLIGYYLKSMQVDDNAAMLGLAVTIAGVLVLAWRRGWPLWSAGWIGYGLIVVQIAPFGLDDGYTVIGWLSSQLPLALDDLFFFARVLLSLGIGLLLAGRDRLSGLLVAQPALIFWLWLESDAIHSVVSLPLLIGAGAATTLGAAFIVCSGEKCVGIRLALLVNLLTRAPFTYARLYHHEYLLPPTTLQAIAGGARDVVIGAALVTGPLWGWALWERIRRLIARGVRARLGEVKGPGLDRRSIVSGLRRTFRRWWFIGAILAFIVVLVTGAHPGGWLDVALNASSCLGVLEEHDSPVQSVAFSPDGALLASGSMDGTARLWRIDDGRKFDQTLLHTLKISTDGRDASYSHDVAFSPDGETLAFGLPDGTVRLWRVAEGTLLRTLRGQADKICSLAFSPDGGILAAGTWNGPVHLWQVADGTLLRTMKGHTAGVVSVAFSPDGMTLASVSLDGTTRLWRVSDGVLVHELEKPSVTTGVAFSPDGSMLATDRQLWRVDDWTSIREMESVRGGMGNVVFSPDGTMLAAGNAWYEVRWWRVADGASLHAVRGHADSVNSVSFSPDGRTLASGSLDGTVKLWRAP